MRFARTRSTRPPPPSASDHHGHWLSPAMAWKLLAQPGRVDVASRQRPWLMAIHPDSASATAARSATSTNGRAASTRHRRAPARTRHPEARVYSASGAGPETRPPARAGRRCARTAGTELFFQGTLKGNPATLRDFRPTNGRRPAADTVTHQVVINAFCRGSPGKWRRQHLRARRHGRAALDHGDTAGALSSAGHCGMAEFGRRFGFSRDGAWPPGGLHTCCHPLADRGVRGAKKRFIIAT